MTRRAKSLIHKYLVEEVKRKRTCGHFGTEIPKGELCLVFSDGFRKSSPYSAAAVKKMIHQAREQLDTLETTFRRNE